MEVKGLIRQSETMISLQGQGMEADMMDPEFNKEAIKTYTERGSKR
jgi:hypothetical protein